MQTFITNYLSTVTTDQHASWDMLTTGFQKESGGFGKYQQYWRQHQLRDAARHHAEPGRPQRHLRRRLREDRRHHVERPGHPAARARRVVVPDQRRELTRRAACAHARSAVRGGASLTLRGHPRGRRGMGPKALASSAMRNLIGIIVVVWLVIGVLAAFQRGYLTDKKDVSCRSFGDTVVTIVAGPLNYVGRQPEGRLPREGAPALQVTTSRRVAGAAAGDTGTMKACTSTRPSSRRTRCAGRWSISWHARSRHRPSRPSRVLPRPLPTGVRRSRWCRPADRCWTSLPPTGWCCPSPTSAM